MLHFFSNLKVNQFLITLIFLMTANIFAPDINAQTPCNVNAINRLDEWYDSPCEGEGGALIDPILFNGMSGTVSWYRVGASMPSAAFTYQNQLYIIPYYNADQGEYMAVFTQNTTGCTDTAFIEMDSLTSGVQPEIQWVQDLCDKVQMKAVNISDTAAANNSYVWMDQSGYYSIFSQFITTNHISESVKITNSSGCTAIKYDYMPESDLHAPEYDSVITISGGAANVCTGNTRTYSVAPENGVTYLWSLPTGAFLNSGQGTPSVNVTYNSNFNGGSISITKSNQCGSVSQSMVIPRGTIASKPSAITGPIAGLCGAGNTKYVVTNVAGITYNWTKPASVTLVSGQGSNQITVNFPSSNFTGTIGVSATNSCGTSAVRTLSVKATPATPVNINGPSSVCSGSTGNAYSIAPVMGAIKYTWTGPSGSHIVENGIVSPSNVLTTASTSITINYGTVTTSSKLKVAGVNACGTGSVKSKSLAPCSPRLAENDNQISNLIVFPNPAKDELTIRLESMEMQNLNMTITDIIGRDLIKKEFEAVIGSQEFKLDLSSLQSGIYLIQISYLSGKQVLKITKQ